MKDQIYKICTRLNDGQIAVTEATQLILDLFNDEFSYPWLKKDDIEFAIELQKENRLEAVKWLCEKAKPHTLTPFKDAKEILDKYL